MELDEEKYKFVIIKNFAYPTYATIQDADIYHQAVYGSKWKDLEEEEQAQLIVMATRKIDSYKYAGQKVDENQGLQFPRIMSNGKISDDLKITELCCEVAGYYAKTMSNSGSNASYGDSDMSALVSQLKEYKVGDFQVNFKDNATIDLSGLDDIIDDALKDWLANQGMEIWL